MVNGTTFNQGDNTGKYFKDMNNSLQQFVGTWQNTTGNITFRIILFKEIMRPYGSPIEYYKDNMGGSFQIIQDLGTANEIELHNSVKYYALNDFLLSSVFHAGASSTALGGWLKDNCASGGNKTIVAFFKLEKLSATTAHWKVKKQEIKSANSYYSFPMDAIMTKIN